MRQTLEKTENAANNNKEFKIMLAAYSSGESILGDSRLSRRVMAGYSVEDSEKCIFTPTFNIIHASYNNINFYLN